MAPPDRLRRFSCALAALLLHATIAYAQQPAAPSTAKPIQAGAQGKIVLIQGKVDSALAASQERWNPAQLFQPLFVGDRVRTLTASRSAVLLIDETQVKLNAGAVLTVQQIKSAGTTRTILGLVEGEGWFRTKNPSSGLTITTPRASAAIRGTEINILIRGQDAVLTVTEGAAEFSNDAGAILVNAGEEATATPGQPPSKRTLLNPEDAVQWVLYYPAHVAWREPPGNPEVERRAAAAADALIAGNAQTARTELSAALSVDPSALKPLVMLAELELTQNRKDQAAIHSRTAVERHPKSAAAHVVAAEVAQAFFDLDAARRELDAALAIDATDTRALVDRARVRFGTGDTTGAREDADRAAALAKDDAQVRSLLGFIELADGASTTARAHFDAAIERDAALGEPHLGLGLLYFQQGQPNEGLLELLTATLLEPKVSLFQSYLGKAYYQLHRFPEGLAALDSAKRLDPRDPTPWLYSSLFRRDLNRHIDALEDLRTAIALNDNRAVYRSRLLLDRDLATKNVSLAQLYNQLGFSAWGASEALNSLSTDLTNASAHLFMAESFGNLPDRTQALSGELLQNFLYAPVNLNSFNNFSEYTATLEQPLKQVLVTAGGGNHAQTNGTLLTRSGNNRFAHTAFVEGSAMEGARFGSPDSRVQAFGQAKLALGAATDLFFSAVSASVDESERFDSSRQVGRFPFQVSVTEIRKQRDPNFVHHATQNEASVGLRHTWRPGSVSVISANYLRLGITDHDPDALVSSCGGLDLTDFDWVSDAEIQYPINGRSVAAQHTVRLGRSQLQVGADYTERRSTFRCSDLITDMFDGEVISRPKAEFHALEHASGSYARGDIGLGRRLDLTVGARYDQGVWATAQRAGRYEYERWNPSVGATVRLTRATRLQAALFRNTNADFISSKLSQPTVAGFAIERNELPTAQRREAAVAVQHAWRRTFVDVRAFDREVNVPAFTVSPEAISDQDAAAVFLAASLVPGGTAKASGFPSVRSFVAALITPPDADYSARGISAFVNQIAGRRFSVFADEQFLRTRAFLFDRRDSQTRAGVNYIHPSGVFARVSARVLAQRFSNTIVVGLPSTTTTLVDASLKYEFAAKRGLLTATVNNLFGRDINTVVESLSVETPRPERSVLISLRWRM